MQSLALPTILGKWNNFLPRFYFLNYIVKSMNSHKNSRFDGNSANFDSYRTYTRMRRSNFYFYENRNGILQIGESVGYDVSVKFGTGRWRFNSIPRVSHSSILRATDTCRRELRPDLRLRATDGHRSSVSSISVQIWCDRWDTYALYRATSFW